MPEESDDDVIEKCAALGDAMAAELQTLRKTARKSHYDKQTPRQIDYAIRTIRRLAQRIRALKGVSPE